MVLRATDQSETSRTKIILDHRLPIASQRVFEGGVRPKSRLLKFDESKRFALEAELRYFHPVHGRNLMLPTGEAH